MSLGLLGAYISSDSSSDSEDEHVEQEQKPAAPKAVLSNPFTSGSASSSAKVLPRPSFMVEQEDVKTELVGGVENSVFQNPFRAKEDRKKAILERHVEMTTKQEEQRTIDGKKICWNYRKGRCRFGSKCTFAHDSDVRPPPAQQKSSHIKVASFATGNDEPPPDPDAVIECNKKPKKRPGLSEGIEPSKKAMKFHEKVYNSTK